MIVLSIEAIIIYLHNKTESGDSALRESFWTYTTMLLHMV